MPYFGDIDIPFFTEKSTSISKDVVEKNFVDEPPQAFELSADLEAGTYTVILHEDFHERNESLGEQKDAVRSMAARHPAEFPLSISGDNGFIIVDAASLSVIPSEEYREAELGIRFMDRDTYRSAIGVESEYTNSEFEPTPKESVLAIPSTSSNVKNSSGSLTPEFSIETEEGTLDLYQYGDSRETIEFDVGEVSSDGRPDEGMSPVRIRDGSGNYTSTGEYRFYSSARYSSDIVIDNGIVRGESDGALSSIFRYHSSSDGWDGIGSVQLSNGVGYPSVQENYGSTFSFVDEYDLTSYRGYSVLKYSGVTGTDTFTFDSNYSLDSGTDNNYYYTAPDSEGNDLLVVRTSTDGSFAQSNGEIRVENLSTTNEYTFFAGFAPSGVTIDDYARYVYNRGSWRRMLVQR